MYSGYCKCQFLYTFGKNWAETQHKIHELEKSQKRGEREEVPTSFPVHLYSYYAVSLFEIPFVFSVSGDDTSKGFMSTSQLACSLGYVPHPLFLRFKDHIESQQDNGDWWE